MVDDIQRDKNNYFVVNGMGSRVTIDVEMLGEIKGHSS